MTGGTDWVYDFARSLDNGSATHRANLSLVTGQAAAAHLIADAEVSDERFGQFHITATRAAQRPIGVRLMIIALRAVSSRAPRERSVITHPGATAFTRMPSAA